MTKLLALVGASVMALAAMPASAQVLTTNGGDGYIEFGTPPGYFYTLYGNNNGVGNVTTTFSAVAAADFTQTFKWLYTTADAGGSSYDPAGYFIGSSFFQLSTNGLPNGSSTSGTITISVLQGQTFGAYVTSTDGILGRGSIAFGDGAAVPEPATWAMMIGGFGVVGGAVRRRKANVSVAFA